MAKELSVLDKPKPKKEQAENEKARRGHGVSFDSYFDEETKTYKIKNWKVLPSQSRH